MSSSDHYIVMLMHTYMYIHIHINHSQLGCSCSPKILSILILQVICSVVGHYVDKVSEHLPDCVGELEQVCTALHVYT